MEKYVCIHGHFYQPPRENPWLEAIEIQDSSYPHHDWNERVNAECYAPNSASRIVDGDGRILDIVSNYAGISFNFGPTLLSWMETCSPEIYQAVLEADRQSLERRSGHGNAIAQVYNHIIMPLANSRDKQTQVIWGIKDFQHRFKRSPEGLWLSETAVDRETLEILSEQGIRFTVLAPHQASKVRKIGTGKWKDVSGGRIDPTRPYLCRLPSGRKISIFFYDGPISAAVAFERLLEKGEDFVGRLMSGFSDLRQWPQILNIATDGETYGHHHKFGDMALAYALNEIETGGLARLTNYGEYLEKYPPTHEVQIIENTSWSCIHGVERWRSDCGCNSGGRSEWNQKWRTPLRESFDWLRDQLIFLYEHKAGEYLKNPWQAREDYIEVILNRDSEDVIEGFIRKHALRNPDGTDRASLLTLLEIQRHALMMYTSCGWFFDELSGLETAQVLQYAGRAVQLSKELLRDDLEGAFIEKLAEAKSNIADYKDGAHIYDALVKPAVIDLKKVGAHYAISSLFEDYPESTSIYCYEVKREESDRVQSGKAKIAVGRISVASKITSAFETLSFSVLHLGDHALNGGVRTFPGDGAYRGMKEEIASSFEKGDFAHVVRLMDKHFGTHNYSLLDLFRDEQRKILTLVARETAEEFEKTCRDMFERNRSLISFLKEVGMPVPKALHAPAEVALTAALKRAFSGEEIDSGEIEVIMRDIKKWDVSTDAFDLGLAISKGLERLMKDFSADRGDILPLERIGQLIEMVSTLPLKAHLWQLQNSYFSIAKTAYPEFLAMAKGGDESAQKWIDAVRYLGGQLFFNVSAVLPGD